MTPDEYEVLRKDFGIHNPIVRQCADMSTSNREKVEIIRAIHIARWCATDIKSKRLLPGQSGVSTTNLLMAHK